MSRLNRCIRNSNKKTHPTFLITSTTVSVFLHLLCRVPIFFSFSPFKCKLPSLENRESLKTPVNMRSIVILKERKRMELDRNF